VLRPCCAGNAFAIFPASPAKVVGIVLMVAHQLVAYGLFILPVCIMFEKLFRTHHKSLWLRLLSRLPVGAYSCC
jgi:auxin influx carrier (AUX1 LAX family)